MLRTLLVPAAIVAMTATGALASSDDGCTKAPKDQWLTSEQLTQKLTADGYKVSKIEIEDNCAEAKVSKDDKHSELYLDPATGDVSDRKDD